MKRIISFVTGLALMSTIIAPIAALADEETTKVFSYETYSVSYEIKSSWDNNQIIEVTLTNTGDEPILNWALEYDAKGEINGIWNGVIFDSNESSYVIKNSGYNYEILPEDSVTFGYTLTGDELDIPESITLCSQREDVDAESYSVSLSVSDDWGSGFNGLITIENLSDRPIEAWRLGFDANFEISNVWNAQLLSSDNNSYSVCSDITTTPIGVGETKTFGFAAVKDQDSIPEITNTSLSEVAINADLTDYNDDSSEIDDSSSEYSDDSSSENDDSSETDSSDVSSESDSSDESSEYEEPVVRPQTYTYEVRNEDCAVDEITISMETAGNLEGTTTVESIMDKDVMCSGVVGLFGEPFDINTSSEFSSAVLTFKVDKSMLGETEFDNLLFLWYDEENENFVELDTEHDEENSTVSTTVTHFSKYMIVDAKEWFDNWERIYEEMTANGLAGEKAPISRPTVTFAYTAIKECVADPVILNLDGSILCRRYDVFCELYNCFESGQFYEVVELLNQRSVNVHGYYSLELNRVIDSMLKDLEYDSWEEGTFDISAAIGTILDRRNDISIVIVASDYHFGGFNYEPYLADPHTRICFLDLRGGNDPFLRQVSETTGGLYMQYDVGTVNYLKKVISGEVRLEDYDNDDDGFSDIEEKKGLIYDQSGNKVKTYWQFPDSDGDKLDDNEEVDVELTTISIPGKCGNPDTIKFFHKMHSRPDKADSDGDGLWDNCDPRPADTINNADSYIYNMTSKQVEDMQRWLERLGYLDMQGNSYGKYGSLTQTAVCLYQINHGFQPCRFIEPIEYDEFGKVPITNIDSFTFATIANEYFNTFGNGEKDYNEYFSFLNYDDGLGNIDISKVIEYTGFLRKKYFTQTPQVEPILTDLQIENRISYSEISSLMFYDLSYVSKTQSLHLYVYDYTSIVDKEFKDILNSDLSVIEFYNNVKPNGQWDVKTSFGWNVTLGLKYQEPFISYNFPFLYRGLQCSPEQLGNIMYGYIGSWLGFSKDILTEAGSAVSVVTSGKPDNESDYYSIILGVQYYEEDKKE